MAADDLSNECLHGVVFGDPGCIEAVALFEHVHDMIETACTVRPSADVHVEQKCRHCTFDVIRDGHVVAVFVWSVIAYPCIKRCIAETLDGTSRVAAYSPQIVCEELEIACVADDTGATQNQVIVIRSYSFG